LERAQDPLRVAVIGCGGKAVGSHVPAACEERLAALVDPDERQLAKALKKARDTDPSLEAGQVRTFSDYRALFDAMGQELDAVIIATPNHQHALPALLAMRLGLHVYVEKPMAHTVGEVRALAAAARASRVATQMGQQGHSGPGCRRLCEYLWAGAIGPVREVHCWSDRANGGAGVRPPAQPVPAGLDWDVWIGPAPYRDYHDDLHPHDWHNWFDFGNGSLGNMGCHVMDPAYWALKLQHPVRVEAEEISGGGTECFPLGTRIRWDFPARGELAPVRLYWYDGLARGVPADAGAFDEKTDCVTRAAQNRPPRVVEIERKYGRDLGANGCLYVGDRGVMVTDAYGDGVRIVPEEQHRAFAAPPATLPRIKGTHQRDFFRACRGGEPACAHFGYSAQLTEIVLLGCLAVRAGAGRPVEWDGPAGRCVNRPELNAHLETPYREGWRL
jgi:predicted dehydrogenase